MRWEEDEKRDEKRDEKIMRLDGKKVRRGRGEMSRGREEMR